MHEYRSKKALNIYTWLVAATPSKLTGPNKVGKAIFGTWENSLKGVKTAI